MNNLEKINQKTALDEIKEPIIGYLGTITSNRVDFDLLEDVAKNHPDNKLVLAGPVLADLKPQIEKLSEYKNVLTLGRIKWDLAPAILDKFAVGIIPHKLNSFIQWTNPTKMFDYLACGLPVVTTNAPGCEIFKDSLYISTDTKDFNEKINLAIAEDSPEKRAERKIIVAAHSWKNRVAVMLAELTKKSNNL
jgi:glycosyltransferase involved in cell wall biosynthesis